MKDDFLTIVAKRLATTTSKEALAKSCALCSDWAAWHHKWSTHKVSAERRIKEQRNAKAYASAAIQYRLACLYGG